MLAQRQIGRGLSILRKGRVRDFLDALGALIDWAIAEAVLAALYHSPQREKARQLWRCSERAWLHPGTIFPMWPWPNRLRTELASAAFGILLTNALPMCASAARLSLAGRGRQRAQGR